MNACRRFWLMNICRNSLGAYTLQDSLIMSVNVLFNECLRAFLFFYALQVSRPMFWKAHFRWLSAGIHWFFIAVQFRSGCPLFINVCRHSCAVCLYVSFLISSKGLIVCWRMVAGIPGFLCPLSLIPDVVGGSFVIHVCKHTLCFIPCKSHS